MKILPTNVLMYVPTLATLHLANPEFFKSAEIDMLISASIFYGILSIGRFCLGNGNPVGWLLSACFNKNMVAGVFLVIFQKMFYLKIRF